MNGSVGLRWLARRETLRVSKLWTQTILAPVVSSLLFIVVFGLSLGGRITGVDGVDYEVFIVPGLIAMAMVQAAYANNASTVFQARSDRYVNDILSAPMHPWQMTLGFVVGGVYRALAIGAALLVLRGAHRRPGRAAARSGRGGGARADPVRRARARWSASSPRPGTTPPSSPTS